MKGLTSSRSGYSNGAVVTRIKVGQQQKAGKPIYLLRTGAVECGKFRYEGRYRKKFKSIFEEICSLAPTKPKDGVLDISGYRYWDAMRIYDDYVVARWCKSVSATGLEKFACETQIFLMRRLIQSEFKRAVGLRWKREFRRRNTDDESTPWEAWQIL
jgi:hypothetical protein